MKNYIKPLIALGLAGIVLIAIVLSRQGKKEEKAKQEQQVQQAQTQTQQEPSVQKEVATEKINITQEKLKQSLETTQEGVKVSDVKLVANGNNIITVSLNIKNEKDEKRNITVTVFYYNAAGEQIGENGFAAGTLEANKDIDMEATWYISEKDVANIKLVAKSEEIKVETKDQNGETKSGDSATTSTTQN